MPTKTKTSVKKRTPKLPTVDRKFLIDLARSIYNPSTKKFLRLCDGKLENGPDPTNSKRPMHCGLGELYFAMTGKQPMTEDKITEGGVIDLAVKLSTLVSEDDAREKAVTAIEALGLSDSQQDSLVDAVNEAYNLEVDEENFRNALDEIPYENDDGCGNACSISDFRDRSKRVAKQLRAAAKHLPR